MRAGRLQQATLRNIWHSLEPSDDKTSIGPERLQKQYVPLTSDSPLFRLVTSIVQNEDSNVTAQDITESQSRREQILSSRLAFISRNSSVNRGMSVPNMINESLDEHLPQPRAVQSAGNLFSGNQYGQNSGRVQRSNILNSNQNSDQEPYAVESPSRVTLTSRRSTNLIPKKDWREEYSHIDIDWSMQAMDVLYNASFYEYIRDERNVDLSALRLCRIIKDYKPKQVANALTWMVRGWSVENTSKLLRIIFSDWLPDLAGCVFSLICKDWAKDPQTHLCAAYLLMSEPSSSASLFLRSLTKSWGRKECIELLTFLDAVLKWDSSYLQEVMGMLATEWFGQDLSTVMEKEERVQKELLSASKKLVLANSRLAMAEYQLTLFQHWSSCIACKNGENCLEVVNLRFPIHAKFEEAMDAASTSTASSSSLFSTEQ